LLFKIKKSAVIHKKKSSESKLLLWDFTTQARISFIGELQTEPLYPLAIFFGLVATPKLPRTMNLSLSVHFLFAAFGLSAIGWQIGLSNPACKVF
jgi:hypothetical protein